MNLPVPLRSSLRVAVVLALAGLVTVACTVKEGSDEEPGSPASSGENPPGGGAGGGGGDSGGGGGGGNGSGLSCSAMAFCSSWSANRADVDDAPALEGGTLADGLYRLEAGTFGAELLLFQGDEVLEVSDGYTNRLGTVTRDGSSLVLAYATRCDWEGDEPITGDASQRYRYAAVGTSLYVAADNDGKIAKPRRFERVDAAGVCKENADFTCTVTNCQCTYSSGKGLPKSAGNPTSFCTVAK